MNVWYEIHDIKRSRQANITVATTRTSCSGRMKTARMKGWEDLFPPGAAKRTISTTTAERGAAESSDNQVEFVVRQLVDHATTSSPTTSRTLGNNENNNNNKREHFVAVSPSASVHFHRGLLLLRYYHNINSSLTIPRRPMRLMEQEQLEPQSNHGLLGSSPDGDRPEEQ